MLTLFLDAAIGRKVRKAMAGVVAQERFADLSPTAIVEVQTERTGNGEQQRVLCGSSQRSS